MILIPDAARQVILETGQIGETGRMDLNERLNNDSAEENRDFMNFEMLM